MQSSRTLISRQKELLRKAIAEIPSAGQDYALVDFPNYANVGDSAIWLGARALLQEMTGRPPAYVSTARSFDEAALVRAVETGPIVITGGGNLGDIWPWHQDFREHLLQTFPWRPIVQLPQSIKFGDRRRARRFADIAGRHANFTLMVRDRSSLEFAREVLDIDALLVPDCAVYLGPQRRRAAPRCTTLLLLRTDAERGDVDRQAFGALDDSRLVDWIEEPPELLASVRRRARVEAVLRARIRGPARRLPLFDLLARRRVERGLTMLSQGAAVVTDRLHGHILSLLLDLPHVALDNSYGKVSGYIDAWNRDYERHRLATTAESALAARRELDR